MRIHDMEPFKKDQENRNEKDDRTDGEEPQLVPSELDIDEGGEGNHHKADLPPAMPPKV